MPGTAKPFAFIEALGGVAHVNIGAHRVVVLGEGNEESVEQHPANTGTPSPWRNANAQLRQRHTSSATTQRRTAEIGPHRTERCAAVIFGDDRHHPSRREHLQHFVVVGIGKRPIFNDAGVTRHLDNEQVIISCRPTKDDAHGCHRRILADTQSCPHLVFPCGASQKRDRR